MATTGEGHTWDGASSDAASALAGRFAAAWRASPDRSPDPNDFLPDDPGRRDAALLALLRADLALRRESGEPALVEQYLGRFPNLAPEVLVALVYEEFCLREEAGETPAAAEYEARFPGIAAQVREVLDIHDFLDSSRDLPRESSPLPEFPEAGETIGGYRLVEELGRGAIARVFLAEERALADRPVALKVSRTGSREPQTLARLQHTHIVPIHSSRVEPATGLHLLVMPYLGRVTLADVIAEARRLSARTGADLLAALDGLRPVGEREAPPSPRAEGRVAFAGVSYQRAIAWWGARLAEALQHAHDRGVLHRDVKPSNVLVTADATPMLLDFNLARPSDDDGRETIGGTPAYMAPEHIEAAAGDGSGVDCRADLYSLGMVLAEALASRPLAGNGAEGGVFALRGPKPHPVAWPADRPVPAALRAILRRCLEPDPDDRYPSAAALAADLQAVADDGPLRFAREPEPARTLRWVARNRRGIALAFALVATLVAATVVTVSLRTAQVARESRARRHFEDGLRSVGREQFATAAVQFGMAREFAEGGWGLTRLAHEAEVRGRDALAAERARSRADSFFREAEPLRYRLITGRGLTKTSHDLNALMAGYGVFAADPWVRSPALASLDPARRSRLVEEVDELLFLWVVASDPPADAEGAARAVAVCDRALTFAETKAPWRALRARYTRESVAPEPGPEPSPRACFAWGLIGVMEGKPGVALGRLGRASRLRPDVFWYQFALAYHLALSGESVRALAHYDAALALRPGSGWARFNRAQLLGSRLGLWESALDDLARVRADPEGIDAAWLGLELGRVAQRLGDFPSAMAHYDAVLADEPTGPFAREARLGRAKLLAEVGTNGEARARSEYDRLLGERPDDPEARFGRASLALRHGQDAFAETELTRILGAETGHADDAIISGRLAARALARAALGRSRDAIADADEALRLDPSPARVRLRTRVALATADAASLASCDPDDLERLPAPGGLASALNDAANRLRVSSDAADVRVAMTARLARAVLFSALGRHAEARAESDRSLAIGRESAEARLVRARVLRRAGEPLAALREIARPPALGPEDSRLGTIRGQLLLDLHRPLDALRALEMTLLNGAGASALGAKARALWELDRIEDAAAAWSEAIRADSGDPDFPLGRARCFARLGRWDSAIADLETAADLSGGHPSVLARVAAGYASCLPARPDRLTRVVGLTARAILGRVR